MKVKIRSAGDLLYEEAASTATLVGSGIVLAYLMNPSFYKHFRETAYNIRHATRTIEEMAVGTEGQRGVESLLKARGQDKENYSTQIAKIEEMRHIYNENETILREAERLLTQLGGVAANGTVVGDEAANKLTGGFFRKIDDFFINAVGNAGEARANLPKITEVYKEFREFYDGREKSEKTVAEFSKYLKEKGMKAVAENRTIENDLDSLISQVDKTYSVENKVFDIDDKVNLLKYFIGRGNAEPLTREEVANLEKTVQEYRANVDETRTSIEANTGIPAYQNPAAWIDYGINPLAIGVVGGLVAKGLTSVLPVGRKKIRNILALPFTLAYGGVKELWRIGVNRVKNGGKSTKLNGDLFTERKIGDAGIEETKKLYTEDYQI